MTTVGKDGGAHATELQIDLAAIVANWRQLAEMGAAESPLPRAGEGWVRARQAPHPPTMGQVAAVLKADAYGTGAPQVAQALQAAGCRHFFVAHLDEALALRPLIPGAFLAVLNGLWPGTAPDYLHHGIRPVLGSLAEIDAWSAHAPGAPALLHVDTGMNRLGLPRDDLDTLARDPARLAFPVEYVMTHLVSAERAEDPVNDHQRRAFAAACARLPPARRSLANSSGLFLGPAYASDLARPGAALYGVNPTPGRPNPMRPVVTLRARILQIRDIPQGATVGYNGLWTAPRPSRIATVSVGYADGYLRSLGNLAGAHFDRTPVPLVGRVSMDLSTFDVTDAPGAVPGQWLELIGPGMPVDAVADRAGTNAYEVLTSLGRRYTRRYLPA